MSTPRDKLIQRIRTALSKGQVNQGLRLCEEAWTANAGDTELALLTVDAMGQLGDKARLHAFVERAVESLPELSDRLLLRHRQVMYDSGNLSAHLHIGRLSDRLGHARDAAAAFTFVARSYAREGRLGEAAELYNRLCDLVGDNWALWVEAGEVFIKTGQLDQAISQFDRALTLLRAREEWAQFVKVAERMLLCAGDPPEHMREVAEVYITLGQPDKALLLLSRLLGRRPEDPDALRLLARAFAAHHKPEKAAEVWAEVAALLLRKQAPLEQVRGALAEGFTFRSDHPKLLALRRAVSGESWAERLTVDDIVASPEDFAWLPAPATGDELEPDYGNAGAHELHEFAQMLMEAKIYAKYRLYDHAIEHLAGVLKEVPHHLEACALTASYLAALGRNQDAAACHLRAAEAAHDIALKNRHMELARAYDANLALQSVEQAAELHTMELTDLEMEEDKADASSPSESAFKMSQDTAAFELESHRFEASASAAEPTAPGRPQPVISIDQEQESRLDPASHFDLGLGYREMGLLDQAIVQFETAAEAPVLRYKSMLMIGQIHYARGDVQKAEQSFKQAIDAAAKPEERSFAEEELRSLEFLR